MVKQAFAVKKMDKRARDGTGENWKIGALTCCVTIHALKVQETHHGNSILKWDSHITRVLL